MLEAVLRCLTTLHVPRPTAAPQAGARPLFSLDRVF